MELKKLQQQWNSFPETSMEERPVLSSDLEKIVVKNPLSNAFYLRTVVSTFGFPQHYLGFIYIISTNAFLVVDLSWVEHSCLSK